MSKTLVAQIKGNKIDRENPWYAEINVSIAEGISYKPR